MRMDQNSRGSYSADFEQFSKFLRNPRRSSNDVTPCNSNNTTSNSSNGSVNGGSNKSLAMVYAVKQAWQSIYDPEIALINGTIFEELDKPFYKSGCSLNGGCRGNTRTGGCF